MDNTTCLVCQHVVFPVEDLHKLFNKHTVCVRNWWNTEEHYETDVVGYTQELFRLIDCAKNAESLERFDKAVRDYC